MGLCEAGLRSPAGLVTPAAQGSLPAHHTVEKQVPRGKRAGAPDALLTKNTHGEECARFSGLEHPALLLGTQHSCSSTSTSTCSSPALLGRAGGQRHWWLSWTQCRMM